MVKYSPKVTSTQKQNLSLGLQKNVRHSSITKFKSRVPFRPSSIASPASSQHIVASAPIDLFQMEGEISVDRFIQLPEVSALIKAGIILDVELDHPFELTALPNDPDIEEQWGLDNTGQSGGSAGADIAASDAWELQTTGAGIVGLIDTGIDFAHPDLIDNIWQNLAEDADGDGRVLEFINGAWELDPGDLDSTDADGNGYIDDLIGWDFVNDDNNPFDDNGHGTHIAGIIGARGNNGIGVSGVAWQTQIMALKAFGRRGNGSLSNILPAMEYARKMGVSLTNNSWGGLRYSRFLLDEIYAAKDLGQIFVAAAGNSGYYNPSSKVYPASYSAENIVSVAASDEKDRLARFSTYGSRNVDLAAPGQRIYSTLPGDDYGRKSGSSMAAGFVSGTFLLLKAADPGLTMSQLISRLLINIDPLPVLLGKVKTGGRLNVWKAVRDNQSQTSVSGLNASFSGPTASCVTSTLDFTNTSIIPNVQQTAISWQLNGQEVSTTLDLNYTFNTAGWYELKLVLTDPQGSSEMSTPIQITPLAGGLDLGPDTSLCASAYVLQTNTSFQDIRWMKLNCPTNTVCIGAEDFTVLDSLKFTAIGGNTAQFGSDYVLTDAQDVILEVSDKLVFSPQAAGTYRMHAIHHWAEITPVGMQAGNNIADISLGIDTCGAILPPHEFRVMDADLLGNEPYVSVQESGIYVLDITDACGNRASDTLILSLTPGCVWPGDINNDGQVSLIDFLSLGIANQEVGPQRPNASADWVGQPAPNWATSFDAANVLAPGLNHKYADANGDGAIDLSNDKAIISDNIGFFHNIDVPENGDGPTFYIEHENTIFSLDGDTAKIEIGIYLEGKNDTDVEDFYGIAFNLNFSDPVVEEPKLTPSTDWLGQMEHLTLFTDGSQSGFGAQFLPVDRRKAGFGMVSRNRRSSRGRGLIAGGGVVVIIDDIADTTETEFSSFTISSENIVLIDSLGRAISSPATSSLNTLSIDLNWIDPSCTELGLTDSDNDEICNLFDICPGFSDFEYPKDGLLEISDQGNLLRSNRIHFFNNKISLTEISAHINNLDIVAMGYESDSNYVAMVNDGAGTLANYRMRLLPNGGFLSTLLHADNRFALASQGSRVLGMAKLAEGSYLVAYSRGSLIDLYTLDLSPDGYFVNGQLRSSNSGLPMNMIGLAKKENNTYYLMHRDGGNSDALYEAELAPDWSFNLTLLRAESRSKDMTDFAFVAGRECPGCQNNCAFSFSAKLILEGPFDASAGLMDDVYRTDGLLSTTDPFGLNTILDPAILVPIDQNAVVDWLKIELRDALDPSQILASQAVLVQRDGDIIDKDGNLDISFDGLGDRNYYIAIKHSSHLGAMTAIPWDMTSNPFIDFTNPLTPVYSLGGEAMKNDNGVRVLWAGDANGDGKINAVDKNLYWIPQNGASFVYGSTWADLNMDGLINAIDLNFYWRFNNSLVEQIP